MTRNPLQEQLLKAGLVKKDKAAQIVREQAKQRRAKAPAVDRVDVQQLQAEHAEHDRLLAAERNAQLRANEKRAQARQIIATHQVKREGELVYRFTVSDRIKEVLVNESQRAQLAVGALVLVEHEQGFALLPRAAADMIYARDKTLIVLDHAQSPGTHADVDDDPYYAQFPVPDDLTW